jgi:Domain of unknown function (DUF397)
MEDNNIVPDWRKSSYSGNGGGNCVEVGAAGHAIAVRDTKQDGAGPVLRFSPAAWRRFASHLRRSLGPGHRLTSARYRRAFVACARARCVPPCLVWFLILIGRFVILEACSFAAAHRRTTSGEL